MTSGKRRLVSAWINPWEGKKYYSFKKKKKKTYILHEWSLKTLTTINPLNHQLIVKLFGFFSQPVTQLLLSCLFRTCTFFLLTSLTQLRIHWRRSTILKTKKSIWSNVFWYVKICIFWKCIQYTNFLRTKWTVQKYILFFFRELQLIIVLLLICDSYMSWIKVGFFSEPPKY